MPKKITIEKEHTVEFVKEPKPQSQPETELLGQLGIACAIVISLGFLAVIIAAIAGA